MPGDSKISGLTASAGADTTAEIAASEGGTNKKWTVAQIRGNGGGGSPGGSDTQVQFNDGGSFGGDAGLTYDKTTDALSVGGDSDDNLTKITPTNIRKEVNAATSDITVNASFWIDSYPTYWDGAASVQGNVLAFAYANTNAPHMELHFELSDDQFTYVDVILDSQRQFYPDTDDTGSLGKAGNTWGDIYATLPTSDPGNGGMWVNAANHNAVTIGSGA